MEDCNKKQSLFGAAWRAVVIVALFAMVACGTNPDVNLDSGTADPENEVAGAIDAMMITSELYEFADAIIRVADTTAERPRILACTNYSRITLDTTSATRSLTINFNGRACTDTKFRQGQAIFTWTGSWSNAGRGIVNFRTSNYFVNGNQHRIRGTVSNNSPGGTANPSYTVVCTDSILYANTIGIATFSGNTTRTWTSGNAAGSPADYTQFRFAVSGSGSGNSSRPLAYIFNIGNTPTPLLTLPSCAYFVSGRIDVTPQGRSLRTLDFGSGNCDNLATLTADGVTRNVQF